MCVPSSFHCTSDAHAWQTTSSILKYMGREWLDKLWHRTFRRPYHLAKRVDRGNGPLVILLHGIARTGAVWQYLVDDLEQQPVRVVVFDLLGFGNSPKPTWLNYGIDDHVQAVITSIERLHPEQPVVVVGHSMGCLIAVRLARTRPDLVRHLVLYEMPLYRGLPNKRVYRLRLNFYFRLYNWIMQYQPTFQDRNAKLAERIARKFFGLEISRTSWLPFVKSLQHTILDQTTPQDIPALSTPMDVIYGSYDMLVIRGVVSYVIGDHHKQASIHTVRAGHRITRKASQFLVSRIMASLQLPLETKTTPTSSKML